MNDGEYTQYIEAAREHGTYQLMKLPFEIDKQDFYAEFKGNVKIKSASMVYKKKSQAVMHVPEVSHENTLNVSAGLLKKRHRPLQRWLAKWSRWLHIYLSMDSLGAIFFFSRTGFTLNHPDWQLRASGYLQSRYSSS